MRSKRTVALALLPASLALLLLLTAGCRRETPVQRGDREAVFHFGNGTDPQDLDPHRVTGVTEHNVIAALLEGLVAEHPETLEPVPGAAERWSVSDDRLVWIFELQPRARWSNGDPVTADDFVFAYRRMLSPTLANPYAYMLFPLREAEAYHKGTLTDFAQVGVQADGPHRLILSLRAPVPHLLRLLQHYAWFPVHPPTILAGGSLDALHTGWTQPGRFVGNGPFTLIAWQTGRALVVRRSETYWDRAAVGLHEIHFHPIADHNTEERTFRAGGLHTTYTVPLDRIAWYRENRPDLLQLEPYLGTYYYVLNVRRPPLDDVRVRRALSLALDRERLVQFVTKAGEDPAYCFTPPGTAGYTCSTLLKPDPDTPRRLLAEAGFPEGRGFPALRLLFNTSDAHERIAQALQQMWREALGIHVTLENMEWKVYLDATQRGEYDIARAGWIADYEDPMTFLDLWVTGGGNNRSGWSSAAYDHLLREAAGFADVEQRHARFQAAEAMLLSQSPVIPLYFYRSKSLVQPSVRGWHPNLLDHHPPKHLRLAPP